MPPAGIAYSIVFIINALYSNHAVKAYMFNPEPLIYLNRARWHLYVQAAQVMAFKSSAAVSLSAWPISV